MARPFDTYLRQQEQAGAARLDLLVPTLRKAFTHQITFESRIWTTPFFQMQVRASPGATGTPILDLSNATIGFEGIGIETSGADTILHIQIDKTTLEGLDPSGAEPGGANELIYDLLVIPAVGDTELLAAGYFDIFDGVTIP